MPDQYLRFVVGTPELHSLSWTLRVSGGPKGAEVYLAPREISNDYHISLHRSGNWHVRIGAAEARALGYHPDELKGPVWSRPEELAPGATLAFRIVITSGAISRTHATNRTHATKKASKCVFVAPPAKDRSIELSVVLTDRPPTADSWVGRRAMGTNLVGFCEVSGTEWITVVSREIETPIPKPITLPMRAAKRLGADPSPDAGLGMMLWCEDADGTPFLLVGRFDEESAARFREKWQRAKNIDRN